MLIDVKEAMRIMASDDTVLEVTPEIRQSYRHMHPPEPEDSLAPSMSADSISVSANQNEIMRSLLSFTDGCSCDIDRLRPAHLLDLVAIILLRQSITNLTNEILRGDVSHYAT